MPAVFRFIVLFLCCSCVFAAPPSSFSKAKKVSENKVYFDHLSTFYCGCQFVFDDLEDRDKDGKTSETMVYPDACGYHPRNPISKRGKINARVSRIEWEHIMPAHAIGGQLDQWKNRKQYSQCQKRNGKYLSGRDCAYKLVANFKQAHNDLNNLTPAIGELNADRSNFSFADISGEPRNYGQCDFEVDFKQDIIEPKDDVKGDIARVYFYMVSVYDAEVSADFLKVMSQWDRLDPVSPWECTKAQRIRDIQGRGNRFVLNECNHNQALSGEPD